MNGELTDLELESVVGGKAQAAKREAVKYTPRGVPATPLAAKASPAPTGGCVGGVCRKA